MQLIQLTQIVHGYNGDVLRQQPVLVNPAAIAYVHAYHDDEAQGSVVHLMLEHNVDGGSDHTRLHVVEATSTIALLVEAAI